MLKKREGTAYLDEAERLLLPTLYANIRSTEVNKKNKKKNREGGIEGGEGGRKKQ